jgi:hypothetical protein
MAPNLLEDLLRCNAEAFAAGEYETAYHALMGALHLADRRGGDDALDRIAAIAAEQGGRIEAIRPPHPLSNAQAGARGTTSVYTTMKVHIDSVRARRRSARAL